MVSKVAPEPAVQHELAQSLIGCHNANRLRKHGCHNANRLRKHLADVKKKFRKYSSSAELSDSDILIALNQTRAEAKRIFQYFSAHMILELETVSNPYGSITLNKKSTYNFIRTSLLSMKDVINEGKSSMAAYLLAELAHTACLFLFECDKKHTKLSEDQVQGCVTGCWAKLRKAVDIKDMKSQLRTVIEDILSNSMLDDDSDILNCMLRDQLLRTDEVIQAFDTKVAEVCEFTLGSVGVVLTVAKSVVRCDLPTGFGAHVSRVLEAGTRLYKGQRRTTLATTLSKLDAFKVRKVLHLSASGKATASDAESAFRSEVLSIQRDVFQDSLEETHWHLVAGWVDFLAALITPDWSCTQSQLPSSLVAWIVKGDCSPKSPDADPFRSAPPDPDRLVGLQDVAAYGDDAWQRSTASAMMDKIVQASTGNSASTLEEKGWDKHWEQLLTAAKQPLEAMSAAIGSASLRGSSPLHASAWLLWIVQDQLHEARPAEPGASEEQGASEDGSGSNGRAAGEKVDVGPRLQETLAQGLERAGCSVAEMHECAQQLLTLNNSIEFKHALQQPSCNSSKDSWRMMCCLPRRSEHRHDARRKDTVEGSSSGTLLKVADRLVSVLRQSEVTLYPAQHSREGGAAKTVADSLPAPVTPGGILAWLESTRGVSVGLEEARAVVERLKTSTALWAMRATPLEAACLELERKNKSKSSSELPCSPWEVLRGEMERFALEDLRGAARAVGDALGPWERLMSAGRRAARLSEGVLSVCCEMLRYLGAEQAQAEKAEDKAEEEEGEVESEVQGEKEEGLFEGELQKRGAEVKQCVDSIESQISTSNSNLDFQTVKKLVQHAARWACLRAAITTEQPSEEQSEGVTVFDDEQCWKELAEMLVLGSAISDKQGQARGASQSKKQDELDAKLVTKLNHARSLVEGFSSQDSCNITPLDFAQAGDEVRKTLGWVWLSTRYANLWQHAWAEIWQHCLALATGLKTDQKSTQEGQEWVHRISRSTAGVRAVIEGAKLCVTMAATLTEELKAIRELGGQLIDDSKDASLDAVMTSHDTKESEAKAKCEKDQTGWKKVLKQTVEQLKKETRHLRQRLKLIYERASKPDGKVIGEVLVDRLDSLKKTLEDCKDALKKPPWLDSQIADTDILDLEEILNGAESMPQMPMEFADEARDFLDEEMGEVFSEEMSQVFKKQPSSRRQWWRVRLKAALFIAVQCNRLQDGGGKGNCNVGGAALQGLFDLRLMQERDPRVRHVLEDKDFVREFRINAALTKQAAKEPGAETVANIGVNDRWWYIESRTRFKLELRRLLRKQSEKMKGFRLRHGPPEKFPCVALMLSRYAKTIVINATIVMNAMAAENNAGRFQAADEDLLRELLVLYKSFKNHGDPPQGGPDQDSSVFDVMINKLDEVLGLVQQPTQNDSMDKTLTELLRLVRVISESSLHSDPDPSLCTRLEKVLAFLETQHPFSASDLPTETAPDPEINQKLDQLLELTKRMAETAQAKPESGASQFETISAQLESLLKLAKNSSEELQSLVIEQREPLINRITTTETAIMNRFEQIATANNDRSPDVTATLQGIKQGQDEMLTRVTGLKQATDQITDAENLILQKLNAVAAARNQDSKILTQISTIMKKLEERSFIDPEVLGKIKAELADVLLKIEENNVAHQSLLNTANTWMSLAKSSPLHWSYARKKVPQRPQSARYPGHGEQDPMLRALDHRQTTAARSARATASVPTTPKRT